MCVCVALSEGGSHDRSRGHALSSQQPLSVCYHGSRLVQALAGFRDRSVLMNSLHELRSGQLLTLGTDPAGSRALQALVTSGSDRGRGKILRKMQVRRHGRV